MGRSQKAADGKERERDRKPALIVPLCPRLLLSLPQWQETEESFSSAVVVGGKGLPPSPEISLG